MSLCQSLARLAVAIAAVLLVTVNPTRAQSQDKNENLTVPLYKTTSVRPSKAGIDADRTTKITPDEVTVTNETTQEIIRGAYDVKDDQIVGAPVWLNSQRFDIDAKVDTSAPGQDEPVGEHMIQVLLSSRFNLTVHRETKLIPAYELIIAGDGPKLRESDPASADSALRVIDIGNGRIMGREVPIATLARILSEQLGRPVLDNTQLSSHYDVLLQWTVAPEPAEPAILSAVQEQLGLKLVPHVMPKEFLVIDHVEAPSIE